MGVPHLVISILFLLNFFPFITFALHWGLIIDAGSTGSRLRIYSWQERLTNLDDPKITQFNPILATDAALLENLIPISSFAFNPSQAGVSLEVLVNQATRWVPEDQWSKTPIILRATAGMRLLPTEDQNNIFHYIRIFLKTTPFYFKDSYATIASGEQEAVWCWLMANYLGGLLGNTTNPSKFINIMELGGASAQIEFIPNDELLEHRYEIVVFGTKLSLYAHSYLRFGKDQFRERSRQLAVNRESYNKKIAFPCFYEGYTDTWVDNKGDNYTFIGTGDYEGCKHHVSLLMGLDYECLTRPCSFFGVYQPNIPKDRIFWGISAYFYTLNGIGLVSNNGEFIGTVADIEPSAIKQCNKTWNQALADLPGTDPNFVAAYCLDANLVIGLLRAQGAENIPISYARKKFGQTISWSLGALIDELNLFPLDSPPTTTHPPVLPPQPIRTSYTSYLESSLQPFLHHQQEKRRPR